MKQKILSILFILLIPFAGFPQNKVSITVAADGSSRDNAISSALYSAIEQSYNSFVSSSTAVLKNKAIVNEMKKQGAIRQKIVENYREIYVVQLSNNKWYALLNATVNINELVAFINKKGIKASVSMGTFDVNVRKLHFDEIAEKTVIQNTICQILTMPNLYDYELKLEEPKLGYFHDSYSIKGTVSTKINNNTQIAVNMLRKAVMSVCISKEYKDKYSDLYSFLGPSGTIIYLRNGYYSDLVFKTYYRAINTKKAGYPYERFEYDMKYIGYRDGLCHFNNIFWIPAYFGFKVINEKTGGTDHIDCHICTADGMVSYYFDLYDVVPNYEFPVEIDIPINEANNYSNFIVKPRSIKLSDVVNNERMFLGDRLYFR